MYIKLKITLLLLLLPLFGSAQLLNTAAKVGGLALKYNINVGAQYSDTKDFEFAGSLSYPIFHKKNSLNSYISSGIDYTGGSSDFSGLNIKPIQLTTFFSEDLFNNHPYTILLNCDAGYLFNFPHGHDGVMVTPNLYVDYKCFFVRSGVNFNLSEGDQQFFVRAGVSFGMGAIKMLPNVSIW